MNNLKKYISKILLILALVFWLYMLQQANAEVPIQWLTEIEKVSSNWDITWWASDLQTWIENAWLNLLWKAKVVIMWIIVIFVVYIGIQMVISMWDDEEKLSSSKRQLRYALIAIIFINIPGTIFNSFNPEHRATIDERPRINSFVNWNTDTNTFINDYLFGTTFNDNILWFFKILIFWAAVVTFLMAGIKILTSRWREEKVTEAKTHIIYASLWLMFLWVIESWKYFAFEWSIEAWYDTFSSMANLALFFAWPTGIFFLTLAGYYYITANGDEDKIKKAKSIVINTVFATLILLASYTFLLDLANI